MSEQLEQAARGSVVAPDTTRELAMVQGAIMIAQRHPRNVARCSDAIVLEFQRPGLAEVAQYQYARGGSDIIGPSIRAAEAIVRIWGNADVGWRELVRQNGESKVEAYAHDLESNVVWRRTFTVKHLRGTKRGMMTLEDPRDVYEHVANEAARRMRACILELIPGDIVDAAMKQAEQTLKTRVDITPDLIANLVEAFGEYGVSQAMLQERLQRHLDAITPAQVVGLRRIYNSLKEGVAVAADFFNLPTAQAQEPPQEQGSAADRLAARLDTKATPTEKQPETGQGKEQSAPPEAKTSEPKKTRSRAPKAKLDKVKRLAGILEWGEGEVLAFLAATLGRKLPSFDDIAAEEVDGVISTLESERDKSDEQDGDDQENEPDEE
jgi:hypothetical protein